ncbi:TonB-dependent siderophore receptor [Cupriavidus necator]|uniref:TonB-dependent siderophore receptor n=1 Tax=Cupriavidus necator TaxID=106590 RepID=A0A367PPC1_CUPNE|nr:TonB-dependent siderophore receptor [Cupriavidus necator]QQX88762.1 TonB-dependent siderophore receptor [Cupriavidus necator]RCJ09740.1 TonB-dependent siderophore receptor [Cupriavidus necator]
MQTATRSVTLAGPAGRCRVRPLALLVAAIGAGTPLLSEAQAVSAASAVAQTGTSGAGTKQDSPPAKADGGELNAVEVRVDRIKSDLVSPTRQVTVLEREEIEELKVGSNNLATMLSKLIPGMADSSRTVTDFGQTLRGRGTLILVDGIPLNTNRDSARNLATIDPSNIEKIEVMRGSSAIYGAGANGGIIAITTRPAGGPPSADTTVTLGTPLTRLSKEGLSANVQQHFSGSQGPLDYAFHLGAQHIGSPYDAHGHRIAPEPSQGDLFDSNVYNVSGKLGWRIDSQQRIELSVSQYQAKQNTDYASDPSVAKLPPGTAAARAIKGLQLENQNELRNTVVNLGYQNLDLLGSTVSTQIYYRDYFTRFPPFDARAVATRGGNVDQVSQNSDVFGGRLTISTPLGADKKTKLLWGADYNQERSDMPLDVFDPRAYDQSSGLVFNKTGSLTYMPPLTTRSGGVFGQLQHKFNEQWSMEGGVRYERANASFDDFVPLSQSKVSNPVAVKGGTVNYGAWLFNIGGAYAPVKNQEFYASFGQGFQLPDIGLQIRNARPGFDINSSSLEPVKTNNYEIGWRGAFGNTMASLALFYTTSQLGDVQSFNNGLILTRTKEHIAGVEASADYLSDSETWGAGGTFTWINGREQPQGSNSFQNMTGYRIPPLKLTAYVQYRPISTWSNRLQVTYYGGRDYRLNDQNSFGRREVSSYTTVDLISRYQVSKKDTITVGIENLFNRYYYPLYSQLMRNSNNTSRLPAAGITLTAMYQHRW